jgi:hypothetical protein
MNGYPFETIAQTRLREKDDMQTHNFSPLSSTGMKKLQLATLGCCIAARLHAPFE